MRPTSLVDEATQGAQGVGAPSSSFSTLGKIPAEAVLTAAQNTAPQNRSTKTKGDGAWAFARVRAPGYYLVTFAKIGYQTQRYVIDSSAAVATEPLSVELTPGDGRLTGAITSARGAVGGATITISDGTTRLPPARTRAARSGQWSLEGLSTPSAYLVTASRPGMSTESRIVVLRAGGRGVVNLSSVRPRPNWPARSRTGQSGHDRRSRRRAVTVHGGGMTRTATTMTNGNLAGFYQLPDLPPGSYTVTMSADGYLPETHQVTIRTGQSQATVNAILTSATAVVVGTVHGVQFDPGGAVRFGPDGKIRSSARSTARASRCPHPRTPTRSPAVGRYVPDERDRTWHVRAERTVRRAGHGVCQRRRRGRADHPGIAGRAATHPPVDPGHVDDRGLVASASPSGTLSCPTGTTPGTDCNVFFTLVDSSGQSVPTRTGTPGRSSRRPRPPRRRTGRRTTRCPRNWVYAPGCIG